MVVELDPSGYATMRRRIEGVGQVTDTIHTLCNDAVQTEVHRTDGEIRVRPDCYTQRAVIEGYDE
jgi:hypothetical protein